MSSLLGLNCDFPSERQIIEHSACNSKSVLDIVIQQQ